MELSSGVRRMHVILQNALVLSIATKREKPDMFSELRQSLQRKPSFPYSFQDPLLGNLRIKKYEVLMNYKVGKSRSLAPAPPDSHFQLCPEHSINSLVRRGIKPQYLGFPTLELLPTATYQSAHKEF